MIQTNKAWIPNAVTCLRIFLAVSLLWFRPLSSPFLILYLLCGLSDVLDGIIARTTNHTSRLGAQLDSAADFVFIVILIVLLWPFISPFPALVAWIIAIGAIRFASVFIGWIKYKTLAMLHTIGNKITGFLLFLFPLSLAVMETKVSAPILCIIASLSALEELLIVLSSKELQLNRKSIFTKTDE